MLDGRIAADGEGLPADLGDILGGNGGVVDAPDVPEIVLPNLPMRYILLAHVLEVVGPEGKLSLSSKVPLLEGEAEVIQLADLLSGAGEAIDLTHLVAVCGQIGGVLLRPLAHEVGEGVGLGFPFESCNDGGRDGCGGKEGRKAG
jgi:hypothetical protein